MNARASFKLNFEIYEISNDIDIKHILKLHLGLIVKDSNTSPQR